MAAVVESNHSSGPPSPDQVADEDGVVYEEEEDRDPHAALVDHVRSDNRNNREALAYLLRYETMVRQQEAEDMATMAHLRPCLERLKELLPKDITQDSKEDALESMDKHHVEETVWTQQVSYSSLRKALEILELQGPTEFMTTDRQLMMILRLVTQSTGKDTARGPEATLTWAELVQCYKTCIVGMTTLQHLPTADETRQRARDRTLAMLALFEPTGRLWSSPVAHPTRSLASTAALSSTQRSSFAPPRATKPRKGRKKWLVAGALLLILGLGFSYHYYSQQDTGHVNEQSFSNSKRSNKQSSSTSRPATAFNARSFVPTTPSVAAKSPLASPVAHNSLEEDEDEFGVAGPALLVSVIGTPAIVVLTQTVLQRMGSSVTVVGAATFLPTFGKALVTGAGFLSLASLFLRSVRALFDGLGRLGGNRDD